MAMEQLAGKKRQASEQAAVAAEQEAEGKFKFVHSRVKQHAESIAFFGDCETDCCLERTRDAWCSERLLFWNGSFRRR